MPEDNWKIIACRVALVTALLALSFGAFVAAGQMVVKENPAVNQTTNQYNSTFNQTSSQFYSNPKFSQNTNETGNAYITKVVFANVSAPGADEYVALYNAGSDVDLYGWTITVGNTTTYTLPGFILDSLSGVDVHFGRGATNSTDIYLNQAPNALNYQHGDVRLINGTGDLLSELKY